MVNLLSELAEWVGAQLLSRAFLLVVLVVPLIFVVVRLMSGNQDPDEERRDPGEKRD